ncbi:MAG: hypothetical protein EAX86_10025 [Candidatus Heimdallarchaeota archaeon]|nr:hypothetical protein [Candidatus Heimdallarchaeota archaeon]
MPKEKIKRSIDREHHTYTEGERRIFLQLRERSMELLETLQKIGYKAFIHGSVARGDVTESSDIDIHIPIQIPSFKLDILHEFNNSKRRILVGTPNSVIKGWIERDDGVTLTFPLSRPKERELEFYIFSGHLYLSGLQKKIRIAGVNKNLLLIEPTENGFWASSIIENPERVIQVLKISQRIVDERIRVLTRRDAIGRTGIVLDYTLNPEENFEQALRYIADRNRIIRKIIQSQ